MKKYQVTLASGATFTVPGTNASVVERAVESEFPTDPVLDIVLA